MQDISEQVAPDVMVGDGMAEAAIRAQQNNANENDCYQLAQKKTPAPQAAS
jgi:hypothetical protein